jgi:hypothetical protein
MNLARRLTIVAVVGLALFSVAVAKGHGSSTPEERADFVKRVRALESDPLAEAATGQRQSLLEWVIEDPDIEVTVCADLLGGARDDKYPYAGELTLHEVLAGAVFVIEHPDLAKDKIAMYLATVEGAIRVYEVLLKSKQDARSPFLDNLVGLRDRGELSAHVAKVGKKHCK